MAFFVVFMLLVLTYCLMKNKTISRYDTVLKIRKCIVVFAICILLSCLYTNLKNSQYEEKIEQMKKIKQYVAIIESNPIRKEYSTQYEAKINNSEIASKVYIKLKEENNLKYGDEISFEGEYEEPDTARNDKGFDYKRYLKAKRNCRSSKNR